MRISIFPGSFDPITKGHEYIINKASELFDEVIVSIGINDTKKYTFSLEERISFIEQTFLHNNKVKINHYNGLTIDFTKQINATHIIRGLRTSSDFEFERQIASVNSKLNNSIETIFFLCPLELSMVSSSIVREILKHKGDVSDFIPNGLNINRL